MKFLVDAQLPYQLAEFLRRKGHDAVHTDDLIHKERTSDNEIRELAKKENRIVITKDTEFLDSFYFRRTPEKLLLITTGNIKNKKLFELFSSAIEGVAELFKECDLIELSNTDIIGHE